MKIPGYTIKKLIGKGGMASVFLAVDEKFERMVAVKIMSPQLSAEKNFRERFLREAKIIARISHPNIVAVYDVNNVDQYYYIAMEFHPGGDLKRRIQKGVSVADALNITVSVAKALDYAHAKGYLHRDIKPDNILFRADGSAVLTDFGIAKATDPSTNTGVGLTQVGLVAGTPTYMSPEQARGRPLTGSADFYSLGVVLYEMFTGKPPYIADDPISLAVKHVNEPVPKLEGKLKHFQPLINGLMAKEPQQRFKNGLELVERIETLAGGYDFRDDGAPRRNPTTGASPVVTSGFRGSIESISATSLQRAAQRRRRIGIGAGVAVVALLAAAALFLPKLLASAPAPVSPPVAVLVKPAAPAPSASTPAAPVVPAPVNYQPQLDAATAAMARGDLVTPVGQSAADIYRTILSHDPGNLAAQAGVTQVANALQVRIYAAAQQHDIAAAEANLASLKQLTPNNPALPDLVKTVAAAKAPPPRPERRETAAAPAAPATRGKAATSAPPVPGSSGGDIVSEAPVMTVVPANGGGGDNGFNSADSIRTKMRVAAFMHRAQSFMQSGNYDLAIANYRAVLDIDPSNTEAQDGLRKAVTASH